MAKVGAEGILEPGGGVGADWKEPAPQHSLKQISVLSTQFFSVWYLELI